MHHWFTGMDALHMKPSQLLILSLILMKLATEEVCLSTALFILGIVREWQSESREIL